MNLYFRLMARRYLYTVHNILPHSRKDSCFFRLIYHLVYKIPHILLVHTRGAQEQLIKEFGVAKNKIHLTSIGLNEEMPVSDLTVKEARHHLSFRENEKVILFFGKIEEYKGLDILLNTFEKLTDPATRLLIAGTFRNHAFRSAIYSQLKQMSRRHDIRIYEKFVPNEEVEVFFKGSDILCLPYRHIYQSGLVFLGPRFGIPMVTTNVGSLREFVETGLGLVSDTNDAAGLAGALNKFFSASHLFHREIILERAKKYQWTLICRDLVPFYSKNQPSITLNSLSAVQ